MIICQSAYFVDPAEAALSNLVEGLKVTQGCIITARAHCLFYYY